MCMTYVVHFLRLGGLIFTCLAIYYDKMHVHLVTYTSCEYSVHIPPCIDLNSLSTTFSDLVCIPMNF